VRAAAELANYLGRCHELDAAPPPLALRQLQQQAIHQADHHDSYRELFKWQGPR
jgi:hypothetical protein